MLLLCLFIYLINKYLIIFLFDNYSKDELIKEIGRMKRLSKAQQKEGFEKLLIYILEISHIPCCGHVINLAVGDFLKIESDDDAIEIMVNIISKCKKLVGSFKHSYIMTYLMQAKQAK